MLVLFPTLVLKCLGRLECVCVCGHVCVRVGGAMRVFVLLFSVVVFGVLSACTLVLLEATCRFCSNTCSHIVRSTVTWKRLFNLVPFITWPIWFCFAQVGEFIIHALQIYFTGFLWLQVWVRQPVVLSVPSFPLDLGCLWKIRVCWHWVTQISVCTFCLSGSRYWEHHSVYVRRGSGSAADCPHVVSFEWPRPSSPVLFWPM